MRPSPPAPPLRAVASLAAFALSIACSGPHPEITYDLIDAFPEARTVAPTLRIDIGEPDARPTLLAGWSWNETAGDGSSFAWALGGESAVLITLNGLRPNEIRFRARVLEGDDAGADRPFVELRVGDLEIAQADLAVDFAESRVSVDPACWGPTDTTLVLVHRPEPPAAPRGERRLAAAWDWLELGFSDGGAPLPTPPELRGSDLELGVGTRLDYLVDLEPGSRFEVDQVEPPGALTLVLAPRGGTPRAVAVGDRGTVDLDAEIGLGRFAVVRLSLLARPAALAPGETVVTLERPRIVRSAR